MWFYFSQKYFCYVSCIACHIIKQYTSLQITGYNCTESRICLIDSSSLPFFFLEINRWRKRGISVVPLKFGLGWSGAPYTVLVSIYATDGTVAVTHGGVEVGQGINTKVCYLIGTNVIYG